MDNEPTEFLSLQQLALEIGITYSRARQLHDGKVLVEDGTKQSGRDGIEYLFKRSRLFELRRLKNYGLNKAAAANVAQIKERGYTNVAPR